MIALMVIIALRNLVTSCHIWSQVVTLVTGVIQDLNNNCLDGYLGSKTSKQELSRRVRVRARNASLIDLLASPQVKMARRCRTGRKRSCTLGSGYKGRGFVLLNMPLYPELPYFRNISMYECSFWYKKSWSSSRNNLTSDTIIGGTE